MPQPSPLRTALGGMLALIAAMGIGRFIYTPILPEMAGALNLTASQAGLIASANYSGYLTGAVIAALPPLFRRSRSWLMLALVVSTATTVLTGLVDGMTAFLVIRFIAGIASAVALVFVSAIVLERVTVAGRPGLSAFLFGGVGLGIALSAVLTAISHQSGGSWRHDWIAGGLVAILAAAAVPWLLPSVKPLAAGSHAAPSADGRNVLRRLILAYGLYGFGYVITMTFLVAIVRGDPLLAHLETVVWVIVGLSAAPSIVLWQRLGRRFGQVRAFAIACAIEAVGVALSIAGANVVLVIASAFLLGVTFIGIAALGLTAARTASRGDPTRAVAVMTVSFGVGQIVGPVFAGLLGDLTGSFVIPTLCGAGALVLGSVLTFPVSDRAR